MSTTFRNLLLDFRIGSLKERRVKLHLKQIFSEREFFITRLYSRFPSQLARHKILQSDTYIELMFYFCTREIRRREVPNTDTPQRVHGIWPYYVG